MKKNNAASDALTDTLCIDIINKYKATGNPPIVPIPLQIPDINPVKNLKISLSKFYFYNP